MSFPLAVMSPFLGVRSETFIRRYVQDLLPGQTAAIAATTTASEPPFWSAGSPTFVLDRRTLPERALMAMLRGRKDLIDETRVIRFLRRHRVRVVFGQYLDFCAPWIRVAQRAGARVFVHAHGYDVSQRLREPVWVQRYCQLLPTADGIITMSQCSRARLLELGLPAQKVHVVAYGTDLPDACPEHPSGAEIRCLAVGRMVAKKAPILLLDSFRRAAEKIPQLVLDYVGAGPLFPAAEQFVRAFGLQQRVTLHGGLAHERVRALLGGADLFLQHSIVDPQTGDAEGLPVSILEAMAHGLPVVATRHAGIPEAVIDGQTGLLVAEGDSAAMADAVVQLARDPRMRREMGAGGWQRCAERFAWQREQAELLGLLGLGAAGSPHLAQIYK